MARYRIIVDRMLCIGAGTCVHVAEKVFQLDAENKAIVVDSEGADPETILLAAKVCPTLAITIIEEATGRQIWPEPALSSCPPREDPPLAEA